MPEITYKLTPHLCRSCGGRVLVSVSGVGMTPGGNPLYRCANCNKHDYALGVPDGICWCGFNHRGNGPGAYVCLPFAMIEACPALESAFRACGCDPKSGQEIGVITYAAFKECLKHGEK